MDNVHRLPVRLRTIDNGSVMSAADLLAEKLDLPPIDRPPPVEARCQRVGRADVWPPEALEEIRRIYSGEDE